MSTQGTHLARQWVLGTQLREDSAQVEKLAQTLESLNRVADHPYLVPRVLLGLRLIVPTPGQFQ